MRRPWSSCRPAPTALMPFPTNTTGSDTEPPRQADQDLATLILQNRRPSAHGAVRRGGLGHHMHCCSGPSPAPTNQPSHDTNCIPAPPPRLPGGCDGPQRDGPRESQPRRGIGRGERRSGQHISAPYAAPGPSGYSLHRPRMSRGSRIPARLRCRGRVGQVASRTPATAIPRAGADGCRPDTGAQPAGPVAGGPLPAADRKRPAVWRPPPGAWPLPARPP